MNKKLTRQQAQPKIEYYCSYQERCHSEVESKLFGYGLDEQDRNILMMHLIQNNYLNEERFALAYVNGKYRQKKWGIQKIKSNLKFKKVSDYCIKKGIAQIDKDLYSQNLNTLYNKYVNSLKMVEKISPAKRQKIFKYLYGKGYSSAEINNVLDK